MGDWHSEVAYAAFPAPPLDARAADSPGIVAGCFEVGELLVPSLMPGTPSRKLTMISRQRPASDVI
jgi:hypothetical protein